VWREPARSGAAYVRQCLAPVMDMLVLWNKDHNSPRLPLSRSLPILFRKQVSPASSPEISDGDGPLQGKSIKTSW
jgi:hypothetical protein